MPHRFSRQGSPRSWIVVRAQSLSPRATTEVHAGRYAGSPRSRARRGSSRPGDDPRRRPSYRDGMCAANVIQLSDDDLEELMRLARSSPTSCPTTSGPRRPWSSRSTPCLVGGCARDRSRAAWGPPTSSESPRASAPPASNFRPEGYGRKLVAEVWLYPDGSRILELSTKCAPADALAVAVETRAVPARARGRRIGRAAHQDEGRPRVLLAPPSGSQPDVTGCVRARAMPPTRPSAPKARRLRRARRYSKRSDTAAKKSAAANIRVVAVYASE